MLSKRKIFIFIFLLLTFIVGYQNTYAMSNYYNNKYGVSLSKKEYNILSLIYWDGYQEYMTLDDYQKFKNSNFINSQIDYKETFQINSLGLLDSEHITSGKHLKIAKACNTTCDIIVTLTWKIEPIIRSYDVMGAYLENTQLISTPITTVYSQTSSSYPTDIKKANNGFGVSFKLPTEKNIAIIQSFEIKKGGHIYASYQHASKTSSLSISKDYTFSRNGYGHVFAFSETSKEFYDQMGGVDIEV